MLSILNGKWLLMGFLLKTTFWTPCHIANMPAMTILALIWLLDYSKSSFECLSTLHSFTETVPCTLAFTTIHEHEPPASPLLANRFTNDLRTFLPRILMFFFLNPLLNKKFCISKQSFKPLFVVLTRIADFFMLIVLSLNV